MAQSLMVVATETGTGKSVVSLGLLDFFAQVGARVNYFKPIGIPQEGSADSDLLFVRQSLGLSVQERIQQVIPVDEVTHAIEDNQYSELLDQILEMFTQQSAEKDLVICEGVDSLKAFPNLESDINLDIARNIDAMILLVANAKGRTVDEVVSNVVVSHNQLRERGGEVLGVIINRVDAQRQGDFADLARRLLREKGIDLYGVLPELDVLSNPRMCDIIRSLDAKLLSVDGCNSMQQLCGSDSHEACAGPIGKTVIAATGLENTLYSFSNRCLIITPGDREEILLAAAAAHATEAMPKPAGVILTGGFEPRRKVMQLSKSLSRGKLPILRVTTDTYETAISVNNVNVALSENQDDKARAIRGAMEQYVDIDRFRSHKLVPAKKVVTPRRFMRDLRELAGQKPMTIVLPEGDVDRIIKAAHEIREANLAKIVLIGDKAEIERKANTLGIHFDEGVEIANPLTDPDFDSYVDALVEARKHKGLHREAAVDLMRDRTYFGTMMVQQGRAHGMVSGSTTTTAATLRPALQFVRTREGFKSVSSVFFMLLPDKALVYGDCAVIPNPSKEQLAEIALASADTAKAFGIEPRVAMLSYSTGASGSGEDVERVRAATQIVKERNPDLLVEGPIQYDAAVEPSVAKTKLPDSPVAGQANVFVFPDLNTGNNTYKAVQRSAGAVAVGPVLQGLKKPVNDLSRGATVTDIVNTIIVTAIQAQAQS